MLMTIFLFSRSECHLALSKKPFKKVKQKLGQVESVNHCFPRSPRLYRLVETLDIVDILDIVDFSVHVCPHCLSTFGARLGL